MKICSKCEVGKDVVEFSNRKTAKDGLNPWCKSCVKNYLKSYNEDNKDKIAKQKSDKYLSNPEPAKLRAKIQREDKDKVSTYQKEYYSKNKEELLEYKKEWYNSNSVEMIKKSRENKESKKDWYLDYLKNWRQENPDYNREYIKDWRIENPTKSKEYSDNYKSKYPHIVAWRTCLRNTLTRISKSKESSTLELMGYSSEELKSYMESLFREGMSWSNWGEWHIDHIIPVTKFDPETPVNIVNALSNLQPLWAAENLSKNNKI